MPNPEITTVSKEIAKKYEDDIARAKAAAKSRLDAPAAISSTGQTSPLSQLIQQFAPECVDKRSEDGTFIPSSHKSFWDEAKNYDAAIANGKEPIIVNGRQLKSGDVLAFKQPRKLYEMKLKEVSDRSKRRLMAPAPGDPSQQTEELGLVDREVAVSEEAQENTG